MNVTEYDALVVQIEKELQARGRLIDWRVLRFYEAVQRTASHYNGGGVPQMILVECTISIKSARIRAGYPVSLQKVLAHRDQIVDAIHRSIAHQLVSLLLEWKE